jgi:two-component system cell cycle response regulator CtrA
VANAYLTGKEYQMLELPGPQGNDLTKEMFLNHLYGGMDEPELKIIIFICKLRKKSPTLPKAAIIETCGAALEAARATRAGRTHSA